MKKASKTQINAISNVNQKLTDGKSIGHSFFSLKRVVVKHEEHAEVKTNTDKSEQSVEETTKKIKDVESNLDIMLGTSQHDIAITNGDDNSTK